MGTFLLRIYCDLCNKESDLQGEDVEEYDDENEGDDEEDEEGGDEDNDDDIYDVMDEYAQGQEGEEPINEDEYREVLQMKLNHTILVHVLQLYKSEIKDSLMIKWLAWSP